MAFPMRRLSLLLAAIFCAGLLSPAPLRAATLPNGFGSGRSGLEMVYVSGGRFIMGGTDSIADGGPDKSSDECPHRVIVGDFLIGKYEVTQDDWARVLKLHPSYFSGCGTCPVEQISWDDVQVFIQELNRRTGEHYRLPAEEEWEFAARGGLSSNNFHYAGSNEAADVAWYDVNSGGRPHPVGNLEPNELGLFDMSGNVSEWCEQFKAPYPCDPAGRVFESRVVRGGMWGNRESSVRVRDRNGRGSYTRISSIGFRLARSIGLQK